MDKGLEYIDVVDGIMHLDKMLVSYFVMIGYEIITRSSQETCS
jgi:hypothetical protein